MKIFLLSLLCISHSVFADSKPNIVFLFCDDLGYGDIQILNPERGKIPTPHIDSIAKDGMTFTDAHTSSSVCTPTRYGLMTGRYSWRTTLQKGVVSGHAPNLIQEDRATVASFLQSQGYHTGIIGKWHLNFRYINPDTREEYKKMKKVPLGTTIPDGPIQRGFDYFHGFHHARSMKVVIEGDTVIEYDDTVNMLPRITEKSIEYINQRAKDKEQPFFLYVPYGSPHTPIVPTDEWKGKSGISAYADFVMQNDASVGKIIEALEVNGLTENTILIFSSDNGCSKAANFNQLEKAGHYASAQYRGSKADLWDGGHRVPYIIKWPAKIQPASACDQLICSTDFFATMYDVLGVPNTENAIEDSVSYYPALSGKEIISKRKGVIHHSFSGHFAYRSGKWKLLLAKGSGGWSSPKESEVVSNIPGQLYDMATDPEEKNNLYESKPEVVAELLGKLKEDVYSGRSTPGPKSDNDFKEIVLWKNAK